jgi:hypothetical protein
MAGGECVPRLARWIVALSFCLGGTACGDGDEPVGCTVAPDGNEAPKAGTVTYTASASALSSVLRIVYDGPNGRETVSKPKLPFSVTLEVEKGAPIDIEVLGNVPPGGTVSAGYSFTDAERVVAPILVSESCEH